MRPLTTWQAQGLDCIAQGRLYSVSVATAKQLATKGLIVFKPKLSRNGTRVSSWAASLTQKGREALQHRRLGDG